MTLRSAVLLGLVVAVPVSCGGKKEAAAPAGLDDGRGGRRPTVEPPVAGYMFATVRERTLGPFLARRGSGDQAAGLAAWVTVAEGSGRRVIVVPIDARGVPRGGETVVANVSVDTTSLVVKPMRGQAPGFVVAWTSLTERGKSLWSVAVADNAEPRTKPVELTRTDDDIVWLDVVPTDKGAVCLWAEETRGSDANLLAAPLDTDGRVRGATTRIASGVVGWHALEAAGGIGLSTVTAPPPAAEAKGKNEHPLIRDNRPGGSLAYRLFDAEGHPVAPPVVVTPKPIVSGDVDVTRRGGQLVFAWTDRSTEEPSVSIATVDEALTKGPTPAGAPVRIDTAHKLADARGGASLLGIASGPAGLAVMFEAPVRRKGESRRVHVARVGPSWVVERPMLSLDVVGRGQPELAATASGFAVLATTPNCEPDAPTCPNADALATVLRTDDKLGIVQREPLTFTADPATLGWGMSCDGELCIALAASPSPGAPSRIRTAVVRPRPGSKPVPLPTPEAAPKASAYIADVTALSSGETVADVASARVGDADVVAILSAKSDAGKPAGAPGAPGAPGPAAPENPRAGAMTLTTRLVTDTGEAGAPNVITVRALPVGGVAIAAAEKPEDGAAVAYVARQGGDPEVRVARIDRHGRKTADVQLTSAKGDASDVTITWAGNGWVVAWVDGRDGNGEVYAAKVTMDLVRVSQEERLTMAKGDASDLTALAVGRDVWLAWADPRERPSEGVADVFVTAVHMRDAKRAFDEQRVLATAAHSRTPQLALGPNGAHVVWIEEAPMGAETPSASGYGAFWAKLDPTGKPVDRPSRVPLAGDGVATSAVLDLAGKPPHAIVARSTADGVSLDGVDLSASPPRAVALLALDGPPSLDVALALADRRSGDGATNTGSIVYFNDAGPRPADLRARRARISWTPEKSSAVPAK